MSSTHSPDATTARRVIRSVDATRSLEGAGFVVRRPFPGPDLALVDPFLMLDEMGPSEYPPGDAKGAPDHPHRGFETVTYILEGEMEHRDSVGNRGVMRPGDVQWMTAGAGVIHSEMPTDEFQRRGGRMHGFQLWVNLPREDKLMRPRYQDLRAADIPVVDSGGATVRVIAGEFAGRAGAGETRIPIVFLHATVRPGATLEVPVPADHSAFVYAFGGSGQAGRDTPLVDGRLVQFAPGEGAITVRVGDDAPEPLEALILAGRPLREPIARYGPFVMNTREEIIQAFDDYQSGRMGAIEPLVG